MTNPIRVALVNDYMIVLEGLRSLLRSSEPEIKVVEMDVRRRPRRGVDVTLLDTYGELHSLGSMVRSLGSDPDNGAIVVFSFSDHAQAVRRALHAGDRGSSQRQCLANRSSRGSERPRAANASF